VAHDLVGQAEHTVEVGHGLDARRELHHDVIALALVVHLIGECPLAPAVDGAGVPPGAAYDLERAVEDP